MFNVLAAYKELVGFEPGSSDFRR